MSKTSKLKYQGKRIKFWKFHLYRMPWALGVSRDTFDDIFGHTTKDGKDAYKFEGHVTWQEWRIRIKKICPIQYWFREDFLHWLHYNFVFVPRHNWYDFKCWMSPYNVLKIKSLPNTWTDESELLVHAIFVVLERYMKGNPWETHDYDLKEKDPGMQLTDEEHEKYAAPYRQHKKDISEAWAWWQKRKEREKQIDESYKFAYLVERKNFPYDEKYKELVALEAQFEKEEEEMIQKILKHRHSLWS